MRRYEKRGERNMAEEKKILIADDSVFAREVVKDILNRNGYENIVEAADGIEAVEVYEKERPDLVLMDLIMDRMDGVEALKKIRKKDENARIIVASAVGQETIVSRCMELGCKGYIVKPIDEKKLISEIKKVTER